MDLAVTPGIRQCFRPWAGQTLLQRALFPSAGHQWGGMGHLLLLSTKGTA